MDIIKVFFIAEFVAEYLKANKNQAKRSLILKYSFAQKTSPILRISILEKIKKNMLPKHSQKAFSVYKSSSKYVSVWCQEKHLHCTISWRPRTTLLNHFKSKCLYISVYLSFCFKDEARFYLVVWGVGGGWIISLRRLIKCFTIFHLNWNFSKFNYFLVFRYFHQ